MSAVVPPHVPETPHGWRRADEWLHARPLVADAGAAFLVAALVAPTSVSTVRQSSWPAAGQVVVIGLILLAHACVATRRVAPVASFAVVSAVCAVLVTLPEIDGPAAADVGGPFPPILLPSALTFALLLYAVVAHGRPEAARPALLVGVVGAAMASARLWSEGSWSGQMPVHGWGLRAFVAAALLASVLAPWALGRLRRIRTAYVAALEDRALQAERDRVEREARAASEERARIAREMHDIVAHSLSVIVSQAEGGRLVASREPGRAVSVLETIGDTGRDALHQMRGLLMVLRDGAESAGTSRRPQPTVDDVPILVESVRQSGVDVTLRQSGSPVELGRLGGLAAYRAVQEGLTNVVKHAGASAKAMVTLTWSEAGLEAEVTDDGRGVDDRTEPGVGLVGMRERLGHVGGTLEHRPLPGGGFGVRAFVPAVERAGR